MYVTVICSFSGLLRAVTMGRDWQAPTIAKDLCSARYEHWRTLSTYAQHEFEIFKENRVPQYDYAFSCVCCSALTEWQWHCEAWEFACLALMSVEIPVFYFFHHLSWNRIPQWNGIDQEEVRQGSWTAFKNILISYMVALDPFIFHGRTGSTSNSAGLIHNMFEVIEMGKSKGRTLS